MKYYSEYAITCSNFLLQALYSNTYIEFVFDVIITFNSSKAKD
jgi:ABC-type antimicrobial peptide transport system permease subunit